ncbi:MAG: substrate-binding domain-containing protein, partial [Tetragenococcus koreensis]|nr:substrate-binding domain-containing protein [Tetragenococcus koreensis]
KILPSIFILTPDELKEIFLGKITNWKEVGGNDQEIVILNRASGSGTRDTFEKWILDDENPIASQEQDSSGMVRQIVSDTPGAISYIAFSYVTDDVDVLAIDGVQPTDENVTTNDWPIWSYEHMYTKGEPTGLTKEFLDYTLSDDVQKNLVGQLGYIPVSQMKVERDANGDIVE